MKYSRYYYIYKHADLCCAAIIMAAIWVQSPAPYADTDGNPIRSPRYIYYNILTRTRPKKYIIIRLLLCRARRRILLLLSPFVVIASPPPHLDQLIFGPGLFCVLEFRSTVVYTAVDRKINYKPSVYNNNDIIISYTKRVRIYLCVCVRVYTSCAGPISIIITVVTIVGSRSGTYLFHDIVRNIYIYISYYCCL